MNECVVRMEMPQDGVCDGCDARTVDFLAGPICTIKKKFLGSNRPSWCPIICQLPEGHGDLIGREYAIATACSGRVRALPTTEDGEDWIRVNEVRESIKSAPTIVPADTAERSET